MSTATDGHMNITTTTMVDPSKGLATSELKGRAPAVGEAEWSTEYVNSLPDSAFAYVESGDKDGQGKTLPRTKRHLPFKDAQGNMDVEHLRNALARLDQTDIPQEARREALRTLCSAAKGLGLDFPSCQDVEVRILQEKLAAYERVLVEQKALSEALQGRVGELQGRLDELRQRFRSRQVPETADRSQGEGKGIMDEKGEREGLDFSKLRLRDVLGG